MGKYLALKETRPKDKRVTYIQDLEMLRDATDDKTEKRIYELCIKIAIENFF